MRLLVAEDYGVLRQAVAQALREAGYVVDESADGDEAVALAHEHHYDVVVPPKRGSGPHEDLRRGDRAAALQGGWLAP
jgi:DNA-binding NtrC family response regulator